MATLTKTTLEETTKPNKTKQTSLQAIIRIISDIDIYKEVININTNRRSSNGVKLIEKHQCLSILQ